MINFQKLSFEELCNELCVKKSTLIIYHVRSDADAVGSAFALMELLRLLEMSARCACADEVPDRLRFISDKWQKSVLIDESEIDSYERIISVDSASPSQLGVLYNKITKIHLMIDHHAHGNIYATNYVDSTSPATAQIVYEIAKALKNRSLIKEIPLSVCEAIYAGISSDTGGFRFANTTPQTHIVAAELLSAGSDGAMINHALYSSKTQGQLKAEGEAARRMNLYCDGKVAVSLIPNETICELGLKETDMETVIDVPRSLAGVIVAVAIRQPTAENAYRVSMRSVGDVDVAAICAFFGGGGHMRAAGCTVYADNAETVEKMIVENIKELIK